MDAEAAAGRHMAYSHSSDLRRRVDQVEWSGGDNTMIELTLDQVRALAPAGHKVVRPGDVGISGADIEGAIGYPIAGEFHKLNAWRRFLPSQAAGSVAVGKASQPSPRAHASSRRVLGQPPAAVPDQ